MSHDAKQPTNDNDGGSHIRLETVFPILIREKDGALSLANPGETVKYATDVDTKIAILATKMNEIVVQLHRTQKVTFHNNKMIGHIDEKNLAKLSDVIQNMIVDGVITPEGKANGEPTEEKQ